MLGVIKNSTMSITDSGFCSVNRTDFGGKTDCNAEAVDGNTLYYALFILGMVVAGAGYTPMHALGIPYMDENVSATVSPIYVGIFITCGIAGKLHKGFPIPKTGVVQRKICNEVNSHFAVLYERIQAVCGRCKNYFNNSLGLSAGPVSPYCKFPCITTRLYQ